MTQYIKFTSDFLEDALWNQRADHVAVATVDSSPGGGLWYSLDTLGSDSWLNQDIKNPDDPFSSKRLQASVRVRADVGSFADLAVTVYENINTNIGEVKVSADLSTGTLSIVSDGGLLSQESNLSDSVFITEELTGEYRIGFTFEATANTDRIIFKIHTNSTYDSAQYTDANLIEQSGDGLLPFEFLTVEPKLAVTRYTAPFANPLNPDYKTEIPEFTGVWNAKKEDIAFDQTLTCSTPDELNAALDQCCLDPSLNYLIEVTVDDWRGLSSSTGDIRISQTCDFLASGGSVFVDTQSGNNLLIDHRVQMVGGAIKGLAWYNVKSLYFNDQYEDNESHKGLNKSCLYSSDFTLIIDGWEAGLGDNPDFTMMQSATFATISGSENDSFVIRNSKVRGAMNDVKTAGPIKVVQENCYFDLQFQDSCYARMNVTGHENTRHAWIKKNAYNGPVASEFLYLLCCNVSESGYSLPGEVYPYEVGQRVEQASGFVGTVKYIRIGDGVEVGPHVGNCRNIAGDGTGWEGDVVYIEGDKDASTSYMVEDEPVVSDTASYTPQFLVTGGAPTGMDGGLMLGFLHTDGHQYGATNDKTGAEYYNYVAGWFSVMSGPNAGAVQQFIHNSTNEVRQKHFTRNAYLNGTATRSHPINHTDTVIENSIFTLAPLGTDKERQLSDPSVSFSGSLPILSISNLSALDRADYDHVINRVVSSNNSNPNESGFDYPWLKDVVKASPYAIDSTGYDTVFGKTRPLSEIDGAVFEREPVVPHDATLEQCQCIIANWIDWYRTPLFDGGWDYTANQSVSGWAHPLNYGKDHNPGSVPVIHFSEWPHQTVQWGSEWTPPALVATDGNNDLTSSVVVTESVNTKQSGFQYVQYDVTNSDGNTVRTYSVVEVTDAPKTSSGHLMRKIRVIGRAEYDALEEKDAHTIYLMI